MTSINIMRLDRESGLCVCDEARYWNPEWMIFYTPEKIRTVSNQQILSEQGLALFMGTTGTSSVGDEFIDQTEREITRRYEEAIKSHGGTPPAFMGVEEAAHVSFEVVTRIKHTHVNDMLRGKYGFVTEEFIAGSYDRRGQTYQITHEDVIAKSYNYLTFDGMPEDVKGIFGNSQVFAGYHPDEGFRIFYTTTRTPVCEEVQEIFLAQGSGRDTCDLVYCDFATSLTKLQRRQSVDRVEALMAMIKGLTNAFKLTAGVGGYPKIIYFNARETDPTKRIKNVFDRRSHLVVEIVLAELQGLITWKQAYDLVDQIIYQDKAFAKVNDRFFKAAANPQALYRFLRGYPID